MVPNMAYTLPLSANMGLLMVVSSVPKTIMRAGDSRSPMTPDTDFDALHKNCAMACRLPICVVEVWCAQVGCVPASSVWNAYACVGELELLREVDRQVSVVHERSYRAEHLCKAQGHNPCVGFWVVEGAELCLAAW